MSQQKSDWQEDADNNPDEPIATGLSGFGESNIPDPMPEELRDKPNQTKTVDAMEGESPTG